jgi:hypothetical protein
LFIVESLEFIGELRESYFLKNEKLFHGVNLLALTAASGGSGKLTFRDGLRFHHQNEP